MKLARLQRDLARGIPFVIVSIAAIAVWWAPDFLNGGYILVGDTGFPLSDYIANKVTGSLFYAWSNDGLGSFNLVGGSNVVFWLIISGLARLGMPLWVVNRVMFTLPSMVAGWSTYYFASTFITGRFSKIACTIASLFAVLAPAQEFQNPMIGLSFATVPLMLALFIRGTHHDANKVSYACLVALSSILVALSPFAIVLGWGIILIYFLTLFLSNFDVSSIKFPLLASVLTLLVNAFWLYPVATAFLQGDVLAETYQRVGQVGGGLAIVQGYAPWSSLFYTSRLIIGVSNGLSKYFSAAPIVTLFSFLLPLYAYSSLIRNDKGIRFLGVTALLLTLFSTGLHYPLFAAFYKWLWNNILPFQIINTPFYYQWVLTFFYAVMIGSTTQVLMTLDVSRLTAHHRFVSRLSHSAAKDPLLKMVAVVLALMMVFYNGGMALNLLGGTDNTINYGRTAPPLQVPPSYQDLLNYLLNSQSDGYRLLVLPFQGYLGYTWSLYQAQLIANSVVPSFSPLTVIGSNPAMTPLFASLLGNLSVNSISDAVPLMQNISVKYVLISKDLKFNNWGDFAGSYALDPSTLISLFGSSKNFFTLIMDTPQFNLYELNASFLRPIVSAGTFSYVQFARNMFHFDGYSAYVAVKNPTFSLANSGSIFAWIKLQNSTGGGKFAVNPTVVDFGSNQAWHLYIWGPGRSLAVSGIDNGPGIITSYRLKYNVWYLVGVTVDNSNMTIYSNGIAILSQTLSSPISTKGLPLYIGHDGTTSFFAGNIRNVQIYRAPLSSAQVHGLYAGGTDASPVRNNTQLLGWWPMNDTASQAKDWAERNNTGVLFGNITISHYNTGFLSAVKLLLIRHVTDSPTEHVVLVSSPAPLRLVFNAKYDRNWVAYANGVQLQRNASGRYANIWAAKGSGDFIIRLEYLPQAEATILHVFSGIAIFLATFMCLLSSGMIRRRPLASPPHSG